MEKHLNFWLSDLIESKCSAVREHENGNVLVVEWWYTTP